MEHLTLYELNNFVRKVLEINLSETYWLQAELSEVKENRGHCFVEFVQKAKKNNSIIAKARGQIWASKWAIMRPYFEQTTGQRLSAGMEVLVEVEVTFHEAYGYSLNIIDIDPRFTLGDIAKRRQEIIKQLQEEGVYEMNKEIELPTLLQRIAVISARGAAGYGDFLNQLHNNDHGLKFYTCLFEAVMQGSNCVPSVIAALDRIATVEELFDCVVIIRGGGSTSDLNSFDNYDLGANIAQFPLPIITGIGHDRDVTIPDMVSKLHVKTPTAAAAFLVQCGTAQLERIKVLTETIATVSREAVAQSREQLAYYGNFIPLAAAKLVETSRMRLKGYTQSIPLVLKSRLSNERVGLQHKQEAIKAALNTSMERQRLLIASLTDKVNLLSPQNTLNRGYSLTTCNGHVVTSVDALKTGSVIETTLADGKVTSVVE